MSYVLHILAALFILALPEFGGDVGAERPWGVLGLCAVPFLLARLQYRWQVGGNFRRAATLERIMGIVPIVLHVVAIAGLGWLQSIERWWGIEARLDRWPDLGLLVGVAPYVVFEICGLAAHARIGEAQADRRRELFLFQLRLFLSALLPFTLYLGLSQLIALSEPLRVAIEVVSLYNILFLAALIALFATLLPGMLRRTWDTVPLERGWQRELLEEVAHRVDFRCREFLVWRTGYRVANAAIIGFTPARRIVLFSDALLAQLAPRELVAVLGHEIGHARRRHAIVFAGYALLLLFGSDLILSYLAIEEEATGVALFLGVFVAWLFVFGVLSRRFELEADLVSAEVAGGGRALIEALEKVSGSARARRSSWRHFSFERRRAFLERVMEDPGAARKLRRTLTIWKVAGLLLLLGVIGGQTIAWVDEFDTERIEVDLRLGRFEAAAERAAGMEEIDDQLVRMMTRGIALPAEERTAEALAEAARRAVERGEAEEGFDLLYLALMRGAEELTELRVLLGAMLEEEAESAAGLTEEDLSAVPESWRGPLRALRQPRDGSS